jgi:hypothetical protein
VILVPFAMAFINLFFVFRGTFCGWSFQAHWETLPWAELSNIWVISPTSNPLNTLVSLQARHTILPHLVNLGLPFYGSPGEEEEGPRWRGMGLGLGYGRYGINLEVLQVISWQFLQWFCESLCHQQLGQLTSMTTTNQNVDSFLVLIWKTRLGIINYLSRIPWQLWTPSLQPMALVVTTHPRVL